MPLGVVGLLGLISGPSMLIAWLKLRQRNIGPLLDANGWAVNAHAMVNVPFGRSLTKLAVLPKGARLDTRDPYADARKPWKLYLALAVLVGLGLAWYLMKLGVLMFFFIWVRWTFPRLRYDQLMGFGWKVLLPASIVNVLIAALWLYGRGTL